MIKFNDSFWGVLFQAVKPITDNVGFVIILYSIFFGILFSGISFLCRKKTAHFLGIFDGLYLLSIFYMLKRLPLIHVRIHKALSTVSSIILASFGYTANFNEASGLSVTKPSEIVYFLYGQSQEELYKLTSIRPVMLYQKFYSTLKKTRSFIGYYVDAKIHLGLYTFLFVAIFFFTIFSLRKANRILSLSLLIQIIIICLSLFSRNGCILALFVLILTRLVFTFILAQISSEIFQQDKKTY